MAVQQLRLCASKARDASSPLVSELRSHMLQGTAKTLKKKKKDIRVHQGTKQKEGRTHRGQLLFRDLSWYLELHEAGQVLRDFHTQDRSAEGMPSPTFYR